MTLSLLIDAKRCSGCQACIVACMDQNDLFNLKRKDFWRQVYKAESGDFPEVSISYISLACMHCQDAPCLLGCPKGAIYKESETGIVAVSQEHCIGCHSCSMACPFGIPRFDIDGKMEKCQMCKERVQYGLEPACVQTCPAKALSFGEVNELAQQVSTKSASKILAAISTIK